MSQQKKVISRNQINIKEKIVKQCLNCRKSFRIQAYNDHAPFCLPQRPHRNVSHILDPNPQKKAVPLEVNMNRTKYRSQRKDGTLGKKVKDSKFRIKQTPKIMEKTKTQHRNELFQSKKQVRTVKYCSEKETVENGSKVSEKSQQTMKVEEKKQVKRPQTPRQIEHSQAQNQTQLINQSAPPALVNNYQQPLQNAPEALSLAQLTGQMPTSLRNPRTNGNYDIAALVHNTNSIISFVSFLNQRIHHPVFMIMVEQLMQLNTITDQVSQLSQNRLSPYNMANVFAERVHDVQVTIVNRIGALLTTSLSQDFGRQFDHFVHNQPQFKVGFTEQQLQNLFPEAMTPKETQCPICLQPQKKYSMSIELQCYHSFHPKCILQWLKSSKKCPMCRQQQKSK